MGYFLRQTKKKKGIYLQMYETYWDKNKKQARTRHIESFGYAQDLAAEDGRDVIEYYKALVSEKEKQRQNNFNNEKRPRISDRNMTEFYAGHYLLYSLIDELGVEEIINILSSVRQFKFSIYDMMRQLTAARVINPCSKSKTVSDVFPMLYKGIEMSEDQVYDGLSFIGENYKNYIELFNRKYEEHYKRNTGNVYFDCTNYYFEIDLPHDDLQKGPSKENRKEPIIGQALLLDSDLVPIGMQMYPGNQSEKPYIRTMVDDMKRRYKISGKTVQIADKGLNCAKNIYAAVKEANDGYIFSKSIHGKSLSEAEKRWITQEEKDNPFEERRDKDGNLRYRLKSRIGKFEYSFKEYDKGSGKESIVKFSVFEKRVVSYTPSLAVKQKAEIMKMVEKASNYATYKSLAREELGDSARYLKTKMNGESGDKNESIFVIDQVKVDEDLRLAGYNLMVTSEINMKPEEIYEAYHGLWKIEESFRITKSGLEARPVYLQKQEAIYGHFLICYLGLFLLRVLEIKCFKNEVSAYDLINYIRDFRIVKIQDNNYINLSHDQKTNGKIKKVTGLTNVDALFLSEKELDNLFKNTILIDN